MSIGTSTSRRSTSRVVEDLRQHLDAASVLESGPDYESARRIWNGAVDSRPAVIVRCTTPAEVQHVVRVAGHLQVPVSVRGGGHDWAGRALREDGVVIDLTGMRRVTVRKRTATVEGGALASDVIAASEPHGLVAATGTVGAVGMTGLTLGGGYGPLNGRLGLAADNLLGADVVLADGRLVSTDDAHDPDLLWALRGGGGNFGVVTAMRLRLHPLTTVLTGFVMFPWTQAAHVLEGFAELVGRCPDELTVQSGLISAPDGSPCLYLAPTWSGAPEEGPEWMDQVTQLGTPSMSQVAPAAYSQMLSMSDALVVPGRHYAVRGRTVARLTPDIIAAIDAAGRARSSPLSMISLQHFHGAPTRVAGDATAFALRSDHHVVEVIAAWEGGDGARHRAWADEVSDALAPYALAGGYPNLLGPDDHEQTAHAYGDNTARLLAVKAHYDPDGVWSATALPTAPPARR